MTRASVTIGQLRDHLSAHLRRVRGGQEILVLDRETPVARLVPYESPDDAGTQLHDLVARGLARPPASPTNWDEIERMPSPKVRAGAALGALLANREEDDR